MILRYLIRTGDALSQLLNVVLLFSTNANESISGRSWRLHKKYKFWYYSRIVIDLLFSPFEENHCEKSYLNDIERAKVLLNKPIVG